MHSKGVIALILILNLFGVQSSIADTDYEEETENTWGTVSVDDGFVKRFTIFKTADNVGYDDFGDAIEYTIEVQCSKKKLSVLVYGDPDIYPETGLGFTGTALMKVDSGKIVKQKFTVMKDYSGVSFNSPKTITTAIYKSKETFSFKIPSSIQNDAVANFSKLDFSSYVNKFKSLGCLLK